MTTVSTITLAATLLAATFVLVATGPSLTAGQVGPPGPPPDGPPPKRCSNVNCPTPLCADPITPPGKCCPTCALSKCKFEGCVQFHPNSPFAPVRWLPEPCEICHCQGGKKLCGAIGCSGFIGPDPCFGRPLTPVGPTPSVCCPRCDFGVPETACRAVPFKRKPFSIQHGGSTCSGEVTQHKCDKIGYRKNGKMFRCEAVERNRYVSVSGNGCDPFSVIAHRDVRYCRAVEDDDLFGAEGCDLIVRPGFPRGFLGSP